ncbi:MAG: L-arabinose ABC transporter permease AraH [Planctomycetes bacterium]|nr:L-arabinose ABC transporter permease AraH [Planctomycetota bacterium]
MRESAGMLLVFAAIAVAAALFVPGFFSATNAIGLGEAVSLVGMVSSTMLFCLASGDFDLSVESIVACSGVLAAVVVRDTGSVALGVAAGIAGGGLVGLVNGVLIARLRVNALIATFATMQIVRGLGYLVSGGRAVGITSTGFNAIGTWSIAGIPAPIWITLGSFLAFGFLLNETTFGRNTLAIGGNREAARLAGIPVRGIKIAIFTIQGLMAGFAGIVLASRMTSGQPGTSLGFSLDCISACVLGGVSLAGGAGTMTGTIVGVLIMGTVQNVMNLLNMQTYYQYLARGGILLAAVLFDQWKRGRAGR